jgi:hypothetical protein
MGHSGGVEEQAGANPAATAEKGHVPVLGTVKQTLSRLSLDTTSHQTMPACSKLDRDVVSVQTHGNSAESHRISHENANRRDRIGHQSLHRHVHQAS